VYPLQVADAMARSAREANAPPPPRRIKQLEEDGNEDDASLVKRITFSLFFVFFPFY